MSIVTTLPSRHRCMMRLIFCVMALAMWAPSAALAQTCSVGHFNGSYGTVDVLAGASVDTTATFSVNCTGLSLFTVRLCIEIGPGSNVNGSGQRLMASGANTVRHELFSDAARSTIWGSWGSVISAYTPAPSGIAYDLPLNLLGSGSANFTVYGRFIGSQTTAVPGTYTWSSSSSPGIRYGYSGFGGCPTGSKTASTTGTTWTATVNAACNVSTSSIGFGTVTALASSVDATGSVSVRCTNTTPYKIALNFGTGSGAGPSVNRRMTDPSSQYVIYTIYRDAAHTLEWGDSLGFSTVDSTGTGSTQAFTGYARVPAQATPASGSYSDTIIATVNY